MVSLSNHSGTKIKTYKVGRLPFDKLRVSGMAMTQGERKQKLLRVNGMVTA
jgi:hypothetical protein